MPFLPFVDFGIIEMRLPTLLGALSSCVYVYAS